VVVVGNGEEAVLRARTLGDAGASVLVVADRPSREVQRLAEAPGFTLALRPFEAADLDGAWLAVSTDPDAPLTERIADAAEARQVFYCAVDGTKRSTFSHVAIARSGGVTLTVSTNGRVPALARRLREELARVLAEAPLGDLVEGLTELRMRTPSALRRKVLGDVLEGLRLTGRLEVPKLPEPER